MKRARLRPAKPRCLSEVSRDWYDQGIQIVLSLDNISRSFGGRKILAEVSWSMPDNGRVGLVGLNGAGKSTLMKLIAGVLQPDSGRVTLPQRARVAYLHQDAPEMGGRSLLDETLSALTRLQQLDARRKELEKILAREASGPAHDSALAELGEALSELEHSGFYGAQSRAEAVLFGLGFTASDLARDVGEFSGGVRMRVALAKMLLDQPDFMMLDEPTNHLDIEARNWLEDYLGSYRGGIIVVSHDRYFLDRVTERTVELARGKLTEYVGPYSFYLREREVRFEAERLAYEKQRVEIERTEAFISRFRYQASKAKLVQSRIKQLEKTERLEPPPGIERPPSIAFPSCERGPRRVFELTRAVKRYGELCVYDGVDLAIERGARIALVGPNGAGKSTMMKLLAGVEGLSAGERKVGDGVRVGYFAQNLAEALDYQKTVLEELDSSAEGLGATELRAILGAMLFSGDDVMKPVRVLSGGERARLALAKVLARRNNCLLLDEPTNNLDIIAKDTLLEALRRFPGTVVLVSHDRHVLNELVAEVVEVGRGHALHYLGNYDDYLRKKAENESRASGSPPPKPAPRAVKTTDDDGAAPSSGANFAATREAKRRRERTERRREKFEALIATKEAERTALGAEMNDPNFYLARKDANELIARYERLGGEIERLYAELLGLEGEDSEAAAGK